MCSFVRRDEARFFETVTRVVWGCFVFTLSCLKEVGVGIYIRERQHCIASSCSMMVYRERPETHRLHCFQHHQIDASLQLDEAGILRSRVEQQSDLIMMLKQTADEHKVRCLEEISGRN